MKKAEQMRLVVQQWKESGLTQKAYCEKERIKRSTFANWIGRCKENTNRGFIALTPPIEPLQDGMEIIYPNGVRLKITSAHIPILSELIRSY